MTGFVRRDWCKVVLLTVWPVLWVGVGCLESPSVSPETSQQKSQRGLLWMFPGLIGTEGELLSAYRGLRDAGLDVAVRFFLWDRRGPDVHAHLVEYDANRAQAQLVARQIVQYRRVYPDAPIDLLGYSAGAAIAVWVAEALPPDVCIRRIVLAQADLSPTYDLTECLEHVEEQLVHLYTPTDWFLSGVFNLLMGTMDRRYVVSAGKVGFDLEVAVADADLRDKVTQVGYSEEWAEAGHHGSHLVILQYRWNKYIVAPWLVPPEKLTTVEPGESDVPAKSTVEDAEVAEQ